MSEIETLRTERHTRKTVGMERTVRPELVEVQSLIMSNRGNSRARCTYKHPRSVRNLAALPFDRLRANGAIGSTVPQD